MTTWHGMLAVEIDNQTYMLGQGETVTWKDLFTVEVAGPGKIRVYPLEPVLQ